MNNMKKHIFEKANLGLAPYRLVNVEMREQDPNGAKVGTSCDYCDTYIVNVFHCQSADGKRFVIGSTCVGKLGDKGLVKQVKDAQKTINKAKRQEEKRIRDNERYEAYKLQRQKELEEAERRDAKIIAERREEINKILPTLKDKPHPNAYFASKGKTLRDYFEYCFHDIDNIPDSTLAAGGTVYYKLINLGGK